MSKAVGRVDAPLLVVMSAVQSDGMMDWFWKIVQQECGIQKTDVRIVYVIDGKPANSGNRPSVAQIKASWPRFSQEMKESKCNVCLPMGGDALYYSTGIDQTILDARGYVIDRGYFHNITVATYEQIGEYKTGSKKSGRKKGDPRWAWVKRAQCGLLGEDFTGLVIPSYGLDHIRTEGFASKPAFKEDVRRCKRALDGTLQLIDKILTTNGYEHNLSDTLRKHEWGPVIAVDIETHGVDNEVIDLVSFSDGTVTGVLDWSEDARRFMDQLFKLPDRTFAVHNSPFDIPRLISNGVPISTHVIDRKVFDTMFGAVVIQPDLHKSLARAITIYHDVKPWKGQRGSMWHELSLADPIGYSAKDAFVTAWLAKSEIAVLKQLGMWDLFMGQNGFPGPGVCETIPELSQMSIGGLKTDRDYAEWWTARLERKLLAYEKLWARMFPGMNPHSSDQVRKLFYETWGLPPQRKTEDSVSADELSCVRLQYFVDSGYGGQYHPGPWQEDARCTGRTFDLLLKIRDTAKTLGTYVQPVAMGLVKYIHPSYMPIAKDDEKGKGSFSKGNTATGRLASSRPNIQNQPKKVRRLYVPDNDDWCFVQADYKSAELYVMAYMAQDDRLIADLASDMHQRNAERFNTTRDTAKNITYASQYLAGKAKVNEMILAQEHQYVPVEECGRIMKGLAEYYYKTTAYKQHLIKLCDTKKYIRNPFGRLRFFHDGRAPAAVDFIPQSVVADILWCVLKDVAVFTRSLGGRLTTTVHDSILCQIHKDKVEELAKGMKRIMEKRFDIVTKDFYIPVEIELAGPGEAWSEVKGTKKRPKFSWEG